MSKESFDRGRRAGVTMGRADGVVLGGAVGLALGVLLPPTLVGLLVIVLALSSLPIIEQL